MNPITQRTPVWVVDTHPTDSCTISDAVEMTVDELNSELDDTGQVVSVDASLHVGGESVTVEACGYEEVTDA